MSRRVLVVAGVVAWVAAAWVAVGALSATGKGKKPKRFVNYTAPAFTPLAESTNNSAGDSVCANFQDRGPGDFGKELNGDLNAVTGSYIHSVTLPEGAKVRQLRLFANDNDNDDEVFAFLVRKRIEAGLSPAADGYQVMAQAQSDGAEASVLRAFTDGTVEEPRIRNKRFYYFVELVNCAVIEPYAVQLAYK